MQVQWYSLRNFHHCNSAKRYLPCEQQLIWCMDRICQRFPVRAFHRVDKFIFYLFIWYVYCLGGCFICQISQMDQKCQNVITAFKWGDIILEFCRIYFSERTGQHIGNAVLKPVKIHAECRRFHRVRGLPFLWTLHTPLKHLAAAW